ncbi:MAG: DUF3080 family protein [Pseudomonadota bacterium]
MAGSVLRIAKSYQCLRALLLIPVAALLVACSQPNGVISSVHTLNHRIANTLNIPAAELSYSPRPTPMPTVRKLKPAGKPAGMNFLTSLRLGHCKAGQQIAQRNSSLGRLEDGLMRYQGDIDMLQALKACAKHPQSAPILDELNQAINDKARQLNFNKAHAIATDKALRNALVVGAQPLKNIDSSAFSPVLSALSHIVDWLHAPAPQPKLAKWRQQLAQSDYLNRLTRSVVEMRLKLQQLQQQLPPLTATAGCVGQGVPERAKILHNVFMQFYINDVQADLAQLTTQYQQLRPVLIKLADNTPQSGLINYLTKLTQQGERLNQASKDFVQPWQQLFADCGFTPGAS